MDGQNRQRLMEIDLGTTLIYSVWSCSINQWQIGINIKFEYDKFRLVWTSFWKWTKLDKMVFHTFLGIVRMGKHNFL